MRTAHALMIVVSILVGGSTWSSAQGGSLTAQDYAEIQQLYAARP